MKRGGGGEGEESNVYRHADKMKYCWSQPYRHGHRYPHVLGWGGEAAVEFHSEAAPFLAQVLFCLNEERVGEQSERPS